MYIISFIVSEVINFRVKNNTEGDYYFRVLITVLYFLKEACFNYFIVYLEEDNYELNPAALMPFLSIHSVDIEVEFTPCCQCNSWSIILQQKGKLHGIF